MNVASVTVMAINHGFMATLGIAGVTGAAEA
jgi:hypothetical protein